MVVVLSVSSVTHSATRFFWDHSHTASLFINCPPSYNLPPSPPPPSPYGSCVVLLLCACRSGGVVVLPQKKKSPYGSCVVLLLCACRSGGVASFSNSQRLVDLPAQSDPADPTASTLSKRTVVVGHGSSTQNAHDRWPLSLLEIPPIQTTMKSCDCGTRIIFLMRYEECHHVILVYGCSSILLHNSMFGIIILCFRSCSKNDSGPAIATFHGCLDGWDFQER